MNTFSFYLKTLVFLTFCFLFSPAWSEPSSYEVEVLIFKYADPQNIQGEIWPKNPPLPPISRAISLQPSEATTSYHYLPTSSFKLTPEERRLRAIPNYQVLLHTAWIQNKGEAPLIHLFGGGIYDETGHFIGNGNLYEPSPLQQSTNSSQWEVDGTLQVSAEQYYKVNANVMLTIPAPPSRNAWFRREETPIFSRFVLQQIQRMKPQELHYFDHPMFGMLVMISKVGDESGTSNAPPSPKQNTP